MRSLTLEELRVHFPKLREVPTGIALDHVKVIRRTLKEFNTGTHGVWAITRETSKKRDSRGRFMGVLQVFGYEGDSFHVFVTNANRAIIAEFRWLARSRGE